MTPGREVRALAWVQAVAGPRAVAPAQVVSAWGEHAGGWLLLAAAGAVLDRPRRAGWCRAGTVVLGAHTVAVLTKRGVRRPRPHHGRVAVRTSTPSGLSFPSAHATSTAAAGVVGARLLGAPVVAATVPVLLMGCARLVLGVHYPSDVLAGAALGAGLAHVLR